MEEQGIHKTGPKPYGYIANVQKIALLIAILPANAIRDFILTLPAIMALRDAYPSAEIALLAGDWHAAYLKNRPSPIDRVISIPAYAGISRNPEEAGAENPLENAQFFAKMKHEQFDIALQLQGDGRYANPFIKRLNANITVGQCAPDTDPLDRWLPYLPFQHAITRYHEIVRQIGATPTQVEPQITITSSDLSASLEVVPEDHQPLVVIHPGANDPRGRWSSTKFAAVGDALAKEGARIVITGASSDSIQAAAVVEHMHMPATDLSNRLSLRALTGLLARARLMITNDTGPLYIASAAGTPTVSIYWCSSMITSGPLTRIKNRPFVSWRLECPICGTNYLYSQCNHRVSFVNSIETTAVIQAAQELFHRHNPATLIATPTKEISKIDAPETSLIVKSKKNHSASNIITET